MRVFTTPTGLHSRAMVRIHNALRRHAPRYIKFTEQRDTADLVVLYVIGSDAIAEGERLTHRGQSYIAVQCCLDTAGPIVPLHHWYPFWQQARLVWSYYRLPTAVSTFNFYHAPLGVDSVFDSAPTPAVGRALTAITTGYVDGPGAEAISEVWAAVSRVGGQCHHIGPLPVGMVPPALWSNSDGISDPRLASLYRRTKYVIALRHIEGFELPAAEGLLCGARPVLFDQPALRHWYGAYAQFVPECHGSALVDELVSVLSAPYQAVGPHERASAALSFDWEQIVDGVWGVVGEHSAHINLQPHFEVNA